MRRRVAGASPSSRRGYRRARPSHRIKLREKARKMATPPSRGSGASWTCRPSFRSETQPLREATSRTWRVAAKDTTRETTKIPKNKKVKTRQSFRPELFPFQTGCDVARTRSTQNQRCSSILELYNSSLSLSNAPGQESVEKLESCSQLVNRRLGREAPPSACARLDITRHLQESGMFRRTRQNLCLLVFSLLSLPLLAQTPVPGDAPPLQPAKDAASQEAPRTMTSSSAKLGAGDLLELSVYGVPDLNTKVRVGNGGDVYLPLIDYVHVADLTVDEAQELIQKRLEDGGFVRNPHVSIFVNESASQAINVMGEVARPGPYPAIGERRLFDLISAAGGLTDKAGRNVTIERRGDPGQKIDLQLSSNLAEDTQNNVDILPGDTIIVSRAGIIYVVGDVNRPSGFMIEDNSLTVLKALALAGGGTRTSALNKTKILRQTPNGVQEIPVNLKKVLYAKAPDMALVKGDVLFIPGSSAKAAAYRTADAAMSMSTALAVVAVHP